MYFKGLLIRKSDPEIPVDVLTQQVVVKGDTFIKIFNFLGLYIIKGFPLQYCTVQFVLER